MAPDAAPIAAPASGIRKISPINAPQNVPGDGPDGSSVDHLVQFDVTVGVLHRDHCIAQLDQVFFLHRKQFLADFFGLRLGWECDNDKITH
jgi:hypothetical protein